MDAMASNGELSFPRLVNLVPDEASAYRLLEKMAWGDNAERQFCPHCGTKGVHYFLTPKNGATRKTRTGMNSERRVWKCRECRKQFSVLTGTIFHGTKISLRTWVMVIFELCSSKNGVAAREIERKYGLTPKTAWHLLHRIRKAMECDPLVGMLSGTIVVDETFIGGKPRNKHQQGKTKRKPYGAGSPAAKGYGPRVNKTAVVSLISERTGEARSVIVPDVSGETLRQVIRENVDVTNSTLHTDGWMGYRQLGQEFGGGHHYVDHEKKEYVRGKVSTNKAENFFGQLKRSIDGTHHHVSVPHLHRYLGEFDFRFTTRDLSDTTRMRLLMTQVAGRRLSYRPLLDRD
jgi:transposase-like protein